MKTETEIFQSGPLVGRQVKIVFAILVSAYFLWAAAHPDEWRLIDGVNLIVHEAGHIIFRPFGEFLMIAGGSLFQVIVPSVFAGYFFLKKSYYSSALVLFWVGESLLNVSVYAADSVAMQLPLLGGNDSIHDWNYMLDHLNLLGETERIGFLIRSAGVLIIISASVWAVLAAWRGASHRSQES